VSIDYPEPNPSILRNTLFQVLFLLAAFAGSAPVQAQSWTSLSHQPGAGISYCLLLTDGGVMCQGGVNWYKLTPDLAGSYVNGTWSQLASPAGYEPNVYAAAVLADGRVVIEGGEYSTTGAVVLSNQGAVYDPKTNTWVALAPPNGWSYIGDAPSCVLANGKFLIGSKLDSRMAELDPASLTWTDVSSSGKGDAFNSEENWTLLPDGSMFTVDVKSAPNSERFLPSTSTWVTAGNTPSSLPSPPDEGPITIAPGVIYTPPGDMGAAVLRPDGTVFAEGGNGHNAIYTPPPANSSAPGVWTAAPSFPSGLAVDDGPASLLPSGRVLAVASPGDSGLGLSFFEFDGTNLIPVPQNLNANADSTNYTILLLLPTGQVLLVDGSSLVQIYTPASSPTYNPAWAPTVSSFPAALTNGATYQITGTQFNGLSQGSTFGDENQNATNYPLVRITNNASGHVFYARTHDHSSMGVATGSAPVSTNFDVPASAEWGASKLEVVANGIPSASVAVAVSGATLPTVTLTCPAATAHVGVSYNSALIASGGQPPFSLSLIGGGLPGGLTLAPGGHMPGIPTTGGVFAFRAQAADSSGLSAGTVTANCTITIPQPGAGPSAIFEGQDIATRGSWKGVYGQDGWTIANDSSHAPAYAAVTPSGASTWTWSPQSVDPRALQTGTSGSYRILSTFYSGTSFSFDFNPTDSLTHQVALYLLDLDTRSRAETISILDPTSNAVLDSQPVSNFNGGIYFIWAIKGHVRIQVTYTGGLNAVLSGLFFDTPSGSTGNTLPTVSISNPSADSVSGTVDLSATAAAATVGATMASVQFQVDGVNLGAAVTGAGPTYLAEWDTTKTANGAHVLTAVATDSLAQSASVSVNVTVSNAGSTGVASATFVKTDSTTQGSWVSSYGQDGHLIANVANNVPSYAAVSSTGAASYTWYGLTTDPRALLVSTASSNRIASTYYATNSFTFDVNFTDGKAHQVALYLLDLDTYTRSETISILDAVTSAVLDTRPFSNFHNGFYAVWNLQGHVLIKVVNNGGLNAVVSGLFFGMGGGGGTTPLPVVSMTAPAAGNVAGNVTVAANATSGAGIATVQFQLDGVNLGAPAAGAGATFSTLWNTNSASNGSHTLTAIATDNLGQSATSSGLTVNVANAGGGSSASAVFVKFDAATQGTWKGAYGQDGELIANDTNHVPAYAAVTPDAASLWTWAASTTDPRALQKGASATDRIASTYYSAAVFSFDVNLSDGMAHQVALYCLDFDGTTRSETISILDASGNAVLDSRSLANFQNGLWAIWDLQGHVLIQVKSTGATNGVVSGIFFGPGGSSTTAPPIVNITAPAAGNVSGNVTLSANASSTVGAVSVQFQLDSTTNLGAPIPASPYNYVWNSASVANGVHALTAIATDSLAEQTTSAAVSVTVNNGAVSGAAAAFMKKDTLTQGTWKNVYGSDGALIANDANRMPAYAAVTLSGAPPFTWAITQDQRALQQYSGSARTASAFYASPGFMIDLNLTDGNTHQLALYFLDWDNAGRAENVTLFDAGTQQPLNAQSISNFQQGAYLVWNVKGHITVKFQAAAGSNAVVSGLFLAPGS
jgi:hypothetical protein